MKTNLAPGVGAGLGEADGTPQNLTRAQKATSAMDGYRNETWRDVGAIDDIPVQGARTVATARDQIAIFRTIDDRVFALDDRCPHKAGRLSQGIVHGRAVTCPLHNWVISLVDGRAAEPDEGCVRTVAVRLEGRRILLCIPA